mmetsp:Transcript_10461/g.16849  ORF Transcript_10461/g.16849 Transcript_10461/m.16849 type:complete len:280 (+) Transcript_10461:417-1256(+)
MHGTYLLSCCAPGGAPPSKSRRPAQATGCSSSGRCCSSLHPVASSCCPCLIWPSSGARPRSCPAGGAPAAAAAAPGRLPPAPSAAPRTRSPRRGCWAAGTVAPAPPPSPGGPRPAEPPPRHPPAQGALPSPAAATADSAPPPAAPGPRARKARPPAKRVSRQKCGTVPRGRGRQRSCPACGPVPPGPPSGAARTACCWWAAAPRVVRPQSCRRAGTGSGCGARWRRRCCCWPADALPSSRGDLGAPAFAQAWRRGHRGVAAAGGCGAAQPPGPGRCQQP